MSALATAVVALPGLAALIVAAGWRRGAGAARLSILASAGAFGLSVLLAVLVGTSGPVSAVLETPSGNALGGLYVDRLGSILLMLVLGVAATVQGFASRYLAGDVRLERFFWSSSLLVAATAAMIAAATLIGLALAWSLAGLALCLLLGLYAGFPDADDGVRRTRRAFIAGDAALWAAVAVAVAAWGNLDLRGLGDQAPGLDPGGAVLALVACLLVVAALARSAQLPLQGWLPATLAAPTPVSALLHAGVINAGGILLVRLSPIFGASSLATHLAFFAGAATAVYGTALMLAKPDIKGALAHSTMGQMGFMVMACSLGAFAAAIFHLVAHGMYKATLFLGADSVVHNDKRRAIVPQPAPAGAAWPRRVRL
ncbi:MAG: proton-conducting transporter membrane subunit, partial [Syntrophothermus sp.]